MSVFSSILNKFKELSSEGNSELNVTGLDFDTWALLFKLFSEGGEKQFLAKTQVVILPSIEDCEILSEKLSHCAHFNISIYPGLEISPYSKALHSENNLFRRFYCLYNYLHFKKSSEGGNFILTTLDAISLKMPALSFFENNQLTIELSDIISPEDLARKLVDIGFQHNVTVEEPGTFSRKGEIFDIYPVNCSAVRLHYFDDMIEEIFPIDITTNRTIRDQNLKSVKIGPTPRIFSKENFASNLRSNIPMPETRFKSKYELRRSIFTNLSNGNLFDNYPVYTPFFFEESFTLLDVVEKEEIIIHHFESQNNFHTHLEFLEELKVEFDEVFKDSEDENILPGPGEILDTEIESKLGEFSKINYNVINIETNLNETLSNNLHLNLAHNYLVKKSGALPTTFKKNIAQTIEYLKENFTRSGLILFTYRNDSAKKEFIYLLETDAGTRQLASRIKFIQFPLDQGFYYDSEKTIVISDSDLFSSKKSKTKKPTKKSIDLFAEQISTLKDGDFVIHGQFGIGKYLGLESITAGGKTSDFLVIEYQNRDKVYVPVYKLNQIQKHADGGAQVRVANLGSKKFETAKARAKKAVKTLAFDLLRLQAERASKSAFSFSEPGHLYKDFELSFPFVETNDQAAAIDDVLEDMQKPVPMDRLVCGDVGFGKTEVAMRAAFKAVVDKKQVAVLVPTTVLALQHFHSFCEHFKKFPINIEFLSRFKTPTESKLIIKDLEDGKIDIVIGTHKILSGKISFKSLGLVIIDEEQRFGVAHKEKLKLLKTSVDVLTLTATPIPRTLQLAFLGIRDLSLIQTAPPKRQSIKTYIVKKDDKTIKAAIEKELARGGQVFYVHNRVQDIEEHSAYIRELVPAAKIIIGHGQLKERELEQRMKDFYAGKYNVLLSTTIIESGIDIPTANTMIIDKANTYGLSQLHQLRGRIGRSERKAYAYFVIPNTQKLTDIATKRLKALQTYAEMGSGFNIASCDLEIRGAGDILGGEQSGHIEEIGLELYMELLKDAIDEIRGETKDFHVDMEIQTPEPAYIPNSYMDSPSERLKYYKKLSNCREFARLENLKDEVMDLFGPPPLELTSLYTVLEVRLILKNSGIKSVKVSNNKVYLQFDQALLDKNKELKNSVIETFLERPKVYKMKPDYSVTYTHKSSINQEDLLVFSKLIASKIFPC
ncbi:MAG: transcription-repair coupling factor [Bacteriovoracaceae bacterium]|nr:transcription-repair coupling factor [Bacteriovoracaceae bacterium]